MDSVFEGQFCLSLHGGIRVLQALPDSTVVPGGLLGISTSLLGDPCPQGTFQIDHWKQSTQEGRLKARRDFRLLEASDCWYSRIYLYILVDSQVFLDEHSELGSG